MYAIRKTMRDAVTELPCSLVWHELCFCSLLMTVAIPQWEGRVSPVFDVARSLLLIAIEDGREVRRDEKPLDRAGLHGRAAEVSGLGVDVLICGAISAPLEERLVMSGVQVIGFVCGAIDDVVTAFLSDGLAQPAFWMPGCGGRRRRSRMGEGIMPGNSGKGSGQGMGRGGGRGRMGGSRAAGTGGVCVCPRCGEKMPHQTGQPCNQITCPKCGTTMTRA